MLVALLQTLNPPPRGQVHTTTTPPVSLLCPTARRRPSMTHAARHAGPCNEERIERMLLRFCQSLNLAGRVMRMAWDVSWAACEGGNRKTGRKQGTAGRRSDQARKRQEAQRDVSRQHHRTKVCNGPCAPRHKNDVERTRTLRRTGPAPAAQAGPPQPVGDPLATSSRRRDRPSQSLGPRPTAACSAPALQPWPASSSRQR